MKSIINNQHTIHFNSKIYKELNELLESNIYSKTFIITDSNTNKYCLPVLFSKLGIQMDNIEIIEMDCGEEYKTIDTCISIWNVLSELGGDRKSLIINLGGGVVTDLGGFVASTFKRGIDFINIPTSLLAMVDASIGGKTGVDSGSIKNQIGTIQAAKMILIDTSFLATLPKEQMRSGLAEMLKHGLAYNKTYWNSLKNLSNLTLDDLDQLIYESIQIKDTIVQEDPYEKHLRKTLNFGHTIGHAIESYCLENPEKKTLLHGEAIAIGMIIESYISHKTIGLSNVELQEITTTINQTFPKVQFHEEDYDAIIDLLKYDKKNVNGHINFVLIKSIGNSKLDCKTTNDIIKEAFIFYEKS